MSDVVDKELNIFNPQLAASVKQVLESEDVDIFVISAILSSLFQSMDWIEYEAPAIDSWLNDYYKIDVSTSLSDKIQAAGIIVGTDYFFKSADMFMKFCIIMANKEASPNSFVPPSYIDIVTGVIYVNLLKGGDHGETYDANIIAYINLSKRVAGIRETPDVLSFTDDDDEMTSIDISGELDSETMWEIQDEKFEDMLQAVKERIVVDYKILDMLDLPGVELPKSILDEYDKMQEERKDD